MAEIIKTANPLAPPACGYVNEQARFDAYVEALGLEIVGGLEWQASVEQPEDLSLHWLKLDADGRAVAALEYSDADARYVRWISTAALDGTVSGAGNAFSLTFSPAFNLATGYHAGRRYVFVANHTITGASTLNVDGLGPIQILKHGGSALASGDIVSGQVVDVVISGTSAWMQTPVGNTATTASMIRALFSTSAEFAVPTTASAQSVANPAGVVPVFLRVVAVCKIGVDGYSEDDEIEISGITGRDDNDLVAYTVSSNDTTITVAAEPADLGTSYAAKTGGVADFAAAVAGNCWMLKAYVL